MHNRRCSAAQPTDRRCHPHKSPARARLSITATIISPHAGLGECGEIDPAVALRYTAGYAHLIPAGLGKKTIKIKITLIYYFNFNFVRLFCICVCFVFSKKENKGD
ncbi:MAG: hypothetical protein LBT09_15210 [Planctomycetaceae bacterium]|jgi:hypothetical protein|nr:hypothetical protein [Planctomycetaceae bacterium]